MHPLMVGAFINSALYLAAVVLTGLVLGLHLVVLLSILAMGLAFLCYAEQLRQLTMPQPVARWRVRAAMLLHLASNWAGIAAGLVLAYVLIRTLRV
jgi:hypothetical protein